MCEVKSSQGSFGVSVLGFGATYDLAFGAGFRVLGQFWV